MINWLVSLFVLALALQHMERITPCATGIPWNRRVLEFCRGIAWIALGLGTFINVMRPFVPPLPPSMLYDTLPIFGVAMVLLISEIRNA